MTGLLDIDDSIFDDLDGDDVAPQRAAAETALTRNPDEYAKTLSLSEKTGLPTGTVERNRAEVEQRVRLDDIDMDSVLKDVPEAKNWAADADNMSMVSDDFSIIGRMKKIFSDAPEAAVRGVDTLSAITLANRVMDGDASPEEMAQFDTLREKLGTQIGTGGVGSDVMLGALQSFTPMANIFLESQKTGLATGLSFAGVAAIAGQAGPQALAPEEILTVPGAAAAGYTVGTVTGGMKEGFRQMRGLAYMDIIDMKDEYGNRVDPETARKIANVVGAVSAPLEFVGLGSIIRTVPGGKAFYNALQKQGIKQLLKHNGFRAAMREAAERYGEAIVTEGSTEAMQSLVQDLGKNWAAYETNKDGANIDGVGLEEMVSNAGYNFVVGGGVGGIYGTPGTAISVTNAYRKRYTSPESIAEQVQLTNENMRSGDGAKIMQRSPERAHRLFQDITGDEAYYIDAEVATQAINKLTPEQQQALFAAAPDLQKEMIDAMASGVDVRVKKADYAAFIAPYPQADALVEHIKLDPADRSVAQQRSFHEFIASYPEEARQLRLYADQTQVVSVTEAEKAIERIVRKSLTDGGRSINEARNLAPLFAKKFARDALSVGIDPVQFFTENALGFRTIDENGNVVKQGGNINVLLNDLDNVRAGKGNTLDAATRQALADFSARMEQRGITPEQARTMQPSELLNAVYSTPDQPAATGETQQLSQMELPLELQDIADGIDQIAVSLSAATDTIPGISQILENAKAGDPEAHKALQDIAVTTLQNLTEGIPSVIIEATPATGLYGGSVEPSLGVSVRFDRGVRAEVLSALARFAENFNQEQVHVRGHSDAPVGTLSPDGSYTTEAFKISLSRPLTRDEVDRIISESGLYGLTFADNYWEAYYVGEPENDAAIAEFDAAIERAVSTTVEIGAGDGAIESETQSLWVYGVGSGAIPYDTIAGDVRSGEDQADSNARIIAEYFTRGVVKPREQASTVTDPQRQLQRKIALDYEAMPDNDMSNPLVRQAYEALRDAVIKQFRELPLKEVTAHVKRDEDGNVVYDENGDPVGASGEPYKNSAEMRRDVRKRNRMTFYATTKSTFGPEGIDFSGHPLLEETEFRDSNGYPLLVNDILRVVHDYYAHNLTATNFGPRGEEAAWVNHMTTIDDPMARWALTSETRGQNSWVNFRPGAELIPKLIDRGFARQKAALLPIEYSLTGDAEVDAPMQELIASLTPEQQNGSVSTDARATDEMVAEAYAGDNELMEQSGNRRLNQSVTQQAQRNGIGLYSMVEKQIMEMQLPQWKPSKQKLLTDEQRARLAELMQSVTSTADPDYQELQKLAALERKEKGVAKGTEVWQKIEKLPVKKEELEWLGLKEFLTGSPNEDFTRDEVVEFVRSNGVQIEEIIADQDADEGGIVWGDGETIDDYDAIEGNAEHYREEAREGGDYEDMYYSLARALAERNSDDPDTAEILATDDDAKIAAHVAQAYEDDLDEAVDEWARERGHDAYYDNPYYRYTTDNGDELIGNDDIGWSLTFSNGKTEFLDAYSLNEAQIRADERLMESGDYTPEDSPEAKKWEDYTTPGSYDNYRERKLTLPGVEGDFYNDTHFSDRNIVAFTRETDRWLEGQIPDGYDIDAEVPDIEPVELDHETGEYGEREEHRRRAVSLKAVMDSYKVSGKDIDEQRVSDFSAWESIISENYSEPLRDAREQSKANGGMSGTYQKLTELENQYRSALARASEYRSFLQAKRGYEERLKRQNSFAGKLERSKFARVKTFFIDEFQSDWHQQGRQYGYEGEFPNVSITQDEGGLFRVKDDKGELIHTTDGAVGFETLEQAEEAAQNYRERREGKTPDAPFKGDGWLALGLKRALVDAVENGYDKFAWADAEILVDRWSERYRTLYETQYDTKMPSTVRRLTGIQPKHVENPPELRGNGGYWYIDIDDKLRNEIKGNSFALFQDARGYIDFENGLKNVMITFTEKANFSTGVHEFSHWAVATQRMFTQAARQKIADGDDNPELSRIVEDWEALKKKVGATGDIFTVQQEEMVAKMFEAYMREGNAPSEGLRRVFTRFRDWLLSIYQDLSRLGTDLDDETRAVFDRWLAAENEVSKIKDKNHTLAMIAQQLGLDASVQAQVAEYVNGALSMAEETLFKKLRAEQKQRDSAEYKDAFEKMRVKVAEEFEGKPEYAAVDYLRNQNMKLLDGPELEGIDPSLLTDKVNGENTVLPDEIADLFGYQTGRALITALKNAPDRDRAIDREVRQRLQEKFPDMRADGRLSDEALAAIYNDRTLLALDTMIKEIGKSTGQNRVNMRQFAKVIAQQQLMNMKASDTGYAFRWDAARDKEMRNALQFARNGAAQMAMLSLQKAMVNHMLYKQMVQFNEEKQKAFELFKTVNQKDRKLAKSTDIDYIGAARGILAKFGMSRDDFDLGAWLDDVALRDPAVRQDLVTLSAMVRTPAKKQEELTVSEFLDIRNAVDNILSVARSTRSIQILGKQIEREKIVFDLTEQMKGLPQHRRRHLTASGYDTLRSWTMSAKSSVRRMEHWVNAMDGGYGGPTRKYLWEPIATAENRYKDEKPKTMKELNSILQKHKARLTEGGKIPAPMLTSDIFGGVFKDRMELIGFLLHTGNESNLEKLLDGYGINRANFDAFMADAYRTQLITKQDMQIVQDLWNFAERLKPLSQRAHKDLYGFRFDEIEASPVITPFGTYGGGYWPAIVDYTIVEDGDIRQAQDQANGINNSFMLPTTGKGFSMNRVDQYRRPLSTDLRLATSHVDNVMRFVYLEPAVRDVSRIVNDRDYREKLQLVDEYAGRNMLTPWLQRVARQETEMPLGQQWKWMAPASRHLRTSASAQAMMLNLANAVQNLTGFSVAVHEVGWGNFMGALFRYTSNPNAANAEVRQLSTEMRVRQNIEDNDIANAVNDIIMRRGSMKKAKNWAIQHGYIFQRLIQNFVDNVTWMAAFDKYIGENGAADAEAIRYADSVVRTTQGSTAAKDISSIEAGSAPAKLFLMFYSYFNNISNLQGTSATNIIRKSGWKGVPELGYMYLMTAAIPFFVTEFMVKALRGDLPDDEDDDGLWDEYLAWFGMAQVRGNIASVPYAGQIGNAFLNRHNDLPMDDRITISPVVSMGETTVRFFDETLFGDGYDDDSRMVRDGLTAIGFMTGLPLGQLGKPLGYLADVNEGDTTPENPLDFARGIVGGPPPQNR